VLGDARVNEAAKRAQAILRRHLYRRKKDSTIDGKPILQLPERTVELQELEFTEEERSIYTAVETKSQVQFNKYLKAGTVLKNYASILVMLLRLRQVAFHPALLGAYFDEMHAEREKQESLERALEIVGQEWVDKVKKDRYDLALNRAVAEREGKADSIELEECPICLEPATANEGGAVITRCKHM
jgi:SNF2 family DNA or RNA helicase